MSRCVKIKPRQTCDTDSLLIVILMWSEGGCMQTAPVPQTPGRTQQYPCCGLHVKTSVMLGADSVFSLSPYTHVGGSVTANQYLCDHHSRKIVRVGLWFKIPDWALNVSLQVCVCVCVRFIAQVCACAFCVIKGHRPDSHQVSY